MKKFFVLFGIVSLVVTIFLVWICIVAPVMYATEVSTIWYVCLLTWIVIDLLNVRNYKCLK